MGEIVRTSSNRLGDGHFDVFQQTATMQLVQHFSGDELVSVTIGVEKINGEHGSGEHVRTVGQIDQHQRTGLPPIDAVEATEQSWAAETGVLKRCHAVQKGFQRVEET